MKSFALPVVVLTASLAALPIEADEKRKSRAWLDTRGALSMTDLEQSLDVRFTGENRAKIESLLTQRNQTLFGLNDQLAGVLRDELKVTDEQLASRVFKVKNDEWNPARLEAIRRAQPQRYEGLMMRKRKQEAREREARERAAQP